MRTYREILGVDSDASQDDIKKAYRRLAMKYHPDRTADLPDDERIQTEEKFKEVQKAYEGLKNGQESELESSFNSGPRNTGFQDMVMQVQVPVHLLFTGGKFRFENIVPMGHGIMIQFRREIVEIDIPPNHPVGGILSVPGSSVKVMTVAGATQKFPHVQGLDIGQVITIDMFDLVLGCDLNVEHPSGVDLSVTIPPRKNLNSMVIPNKGLTDGIRTGNYILSVKPVIRELSDKQRESMKKILDED